MSSKIKTFLYVLLTIFTITMLNYIREEKFADHQGRVINYESLSNLAIKLKVNNDQQERKAREYDYPLYGKDEQLEFKFVTRDQLLDTPSDSHQYDTNEASIAKTPTIFCIIITYEDNLDRAKLIANTWAHKCDNYKLVTLISKILLNETQARMAKSNRVVVESNFYNLFQPPGITYERNSNGDSYNLTDKVLKTMKYIYKKYPNYDWYLKADDDTFIFVDNLRKFLKDKNSAEPVTYGYNFGKVVKGGYHSGGAGYLLSHEAFKRLGVKLNKNFKFCENSGTEDTDVASCLRRLEVYVGESVDDLGRERFHPFELDDYFSLDEFPSWIYHYASNFPKKGSSCCSDSTISFHYMSNKQIKRINELIESDSYYARNMTALYEMLHRRIISASEVKNLEKLNDEAKYVDTRDIDDDDYYDEYYDDIIEL